MASRVVLLLAANVGGNKVFSPKQFVQDHPGLELINIGHAGTFVSTRKGSEAELRSAIAAALPIEADMIIVDGERLRGLIELDLPRPAAAKLEATFLDGPADGLTVGTTWDEVEVVHVDSDIVVTARVPGGRRSPVAEIQRATGRRGTTRSWGVVGKIAKAACTD